MLHKRKYLRFVHLNQPRDFMEVPGPQDCVQLPGGLVYRLPHAQVHPELAVECATEQFECVAVWLGVGHDVPGFLRWIERDLVRFTPLVQLGLTLLGLCHDGVDADIVFEFTEPVQVVSKGDFHEPRLLESAPGILVEQVPECGSKHGALEHNVSEEHLVRSLAFHDHLSGRCCSQDTTRVTKAG